MANRQLMAHVSVQGTAMSETALCSECEPFNVQTANPIALPDPNYTDDPWDGGPRVDCTENTELACQGCGWALGADLGHSPSITFGEGAEDAWLRMLETVSKAGDVDARHFGYQVGVVTTDGRVFDAELLTTHHRGPEPDRLFGVTFRPIRDNFDEQPREIPLWLALDDITIIEIY